MSVRKKAFLIFLGLTILLFTGSIAISRVFLIKGYNVLEREGAYLDVARILNKIDETSEQIGATAIDWATWDDCYSFLQTRTPEFIEKNISSSILTNINVNGIFFTDSTLEPFFQYGYNFDEKKPAHYSKDFVEQLTQKISAAFNKNNIRSLQGVLSTQDSIFFVAVARVTQSSGEGNNYGYLIMVRHYSEELVMHMEKSFRTSLMLYPPSTSPLNRTTLHKFENNMATEYLDSNKIACYGTITGIDSSLAGVIQVVNPRTISQRGHKTAFIILCSFFFICLIFSFISWYLINRLILSPLLKLEKEVSYIDSLSNRVNINAKDEIGKLGSMINRMLQSLSQSQESLKRREKDFYELLEKTPAGILLVDSESRKISWANMNSLLVLRAEKNDIEGRMLSHILDPQIFSIQPDSVSETILRRFDGTQIPIMTSTGYIEFQDKPHRVIAFFNMERQKQLEDRLSQAHKMEAIGILAGGVAHDLNNILSPLVSYPELVLLQIGEDHPLRKAMVTIRTSGLKAAAIVQDLLTLARRGVNTTIVTNINAIIDDFLKSPEYEKIRAFHPSVSFSVNLQDVIPNTKGSPFHESKMVMNLVSNAAEAIKDTGKVEIKTFTTIIEKVLEGYERIPPGEYVVLVVKDTGVGLSPDEICKIFEPFYTKKTMGRSGTGLGMAVVWSTVKDHKGFIDIVTEPGKGTTLSLYLPATRESIAAIEESVPLDQLKGQGELALVVDDVPEQREIATILISKLGYTVKTVPSGEMAVDYLKSNRAAVVLIDMIMDPGIDGLETYRRILDIRPNQKAIIVSGFAETIRIKEAMNAGAKFYLKKPYTLEQLGKALRSVLSGT